MHEVRRHGWQQLKDATGHSVLGLKAAWRHETAFRQECILVLAMLPAACWLGADMTQRAILIFSLLCILIVELLNSTVEAAIDRIGPERHELSRQARNPGSASVMVCLLATAVIWGLIAREAWWG